MSHKYSNSNPIRRMNEFHNSHSVMFCLLTCDAITYHMHTVLTRVYSLRLIQLLLFAQIWQHTGLRCQSQVDTLFAHIFLLSLLRLVNSLVVGRRRVVVYAVWVCHSIRCDCDSWVFAPYVNTSRHVFVFNRHNHPIEFKIDCWRYFAIFIAASQYNFELVSLSVLWSASNGQFPFRLGQRYIHQRIIFSKYAIDASQIK